MRKIGMIKNSIDAFKLCCQAVSPYSAVKESIRISENDIQIMSTRIPLTERTKVVLIAFGKAVLPMVNAAEESLADHLKAGVVIAPKGCKDNSIFFTPASQLFEGAENNLPDAESVAATGKALELIQEHDSPDTVFLFLIAGGGSALFCSPRGINLEEKLATIQLLSSHGATIQQLNTVRQRLSNVKGGKTMEYIKEGRAVSLIVSDIIGDPIHLIASGPTAKQDTVVDVMSILKELHVEDKVGKNVLEKLKDPLPVPSSTVECDNYIISSNNVALESLARIVQYEGFTPLIVSDSLCGNATVVGEWLADIAISPNTAALEETIRLRYPESGKIPEKKKLALIFGGETTVVIKGPGKGGRNQEIALSSLIKIVESRKVAHKFLVMSCGTDGQDGPTDAAGACFDSTMLESVELEEAIKHLENSDSYNFWNNFLDGVCHVKTGPTGTNVMDVQMILLEY